ncbi:MAG TPA: 5-(carboxyamino)imidazole ribonucleotide mutase [Bacteroidetes bacterium]|nr:MAG: 5-(carboxyamino)imidazole ribonucleotide mutase [Ignavibacteria bacterium GWA2_54_16]HCA80265.1 5-(carboxyamino)imidazole ribonucleotide mutase [Bacteroidota bacterium]
MASRRKTSEKRPLVAIMLGSASDLEQVEPARSTLREFGVPCELRVLSAHRTPDHALKYAAEAESRGIEVIIAAAGGAAHLPGVVAAKTLLPVIGIPIKSKALNGLDSLLSIVQMPAGIPVATVAIDGSANAALLAVAIMAGKHPELRKKLRKYRKTLEEKVLGAKV